VRKVVRSAKARAGLAMVGLIWILGSAIIAVPAVAAEAVTDSADAKRREIDELVARVITAFENLDLPAFMACFADDATGFFPVPGPPGLFEGKSAIQRQFERLFGEVRRSHNAGPPYFHIIPGNSQVQILSPDAALVFFDQRNTQRNGRRTLVFRKSQGQWFIVHFHASNISLGPEPHRPG
jgi:ketosteroid isomerase-like protein